MLYTTFALAHHANACATSYRKLGTALGGIHAYGRHTPIALDKILEVCGLRDTIWAMRCTTIPSDDILIEFACRCAEHVLHYYEDTYPEDKRPRQAIEAARVCLTDKSTAARAAARAAAWAAAGDAARAAARAAAWAAAWAAVGAAAGDAARAAARAAAWAAARAAARAAAWAAAGDGETEWQTTTLLELLHRTGED